MEKHIKKWAEKGYITKEQSDLILDDYTKEKRKASRLAINITLYTIGAILTGIGVICFVAANDWILKLFYSRFAKMAAGLIFTFFVFGLGYYFSFIKTDLKKLGDVLIFISCILTGGLWVLIGQIYNIHTSQNFLIFFIWLISALPVAFLFKKKDVNFLCTILFIAAYSSAPGLNDSLQILSPVVFGLLLYNISNLPFIKKNFSEFSSLYKTFSIIPVFISMLTMFCISNPAIEDKVSSFLILSFMLAFLALNYVFNKDKDDILKTESIIMALISIFGMILCFEFSKTPEMVITILFSNTIIILIISSLYYFGYKLQKINRVNLANLFLLFYIAVLYFKIGFNYLDRALFFFLGGVILIGLGIYLEKQKNIKIKTGKKNE